MLVERLIRIAGLLVCVGVIVTYRVLYPATSPFLFALYSLVVIFMVLTAVSAMARDRYERMAPAAGSYCVVVPAYNEDPALLTRCIYSLLGQTVLPRMIYVVDDGSTPPVEWHKHPLVTWVRQENAGKKAAQMAGLKQEARWAPNYVLTVDSDSIVERSACERALRVFNDERVMAVTGLPVLLNVKYGVLTRLVDLEIVSGCLLGRASRSWLGVVSPASGAFAMYRAALLYANAEDYLASGRLGDDRRLAVYGLVRGRVVALNKALVQVDMPTTLHASYKQRMRWFKAFWLYLPWEITVLPNKALFFRVWALVFGIITPLVLVWMFLVIPLAAHHFYWQGLAFWVVIGYTQTAPYLFYRPGVHWAQRLWWWYALSPLLILWQLFVVRPALFHALCVCRSGAWETR